MIVENAATTGTTQLAEHGAVIASVPRSSLSWRSSASNSPSARHPSYARRRS
jgi:hypothetical protein